jgi:hypothetical protein
MISGRCTLERLSEGKLVFAPRVHDGLIKARPEWRPDTFHPI